MKTPRTLLILPLIPFALLALVALIGWGCSEQSQEQAEGVYEDTKDTLQYSAEKTGDSLANAWDKVADVSVNQKNSFISSLETAFAKLESEAKNLQEESGDISDEVVKQFDEAGEAFQQQMKKAGNASADAWDSTKDGVGKAWNNLVEAYQRMKSETPRNQGG